MTRRVMVRSALAGAATGLLSWAFGVQGARPALIGCCVLLGVAVVLSVPAGSYGSWPVRPHTATGGGSSQIWRLANRLRGLDADRRGTDPALQYRLRRLAAARLRRLGVDWADPRAGQLLGPDVHTTLDGETFQPGLRDVEQIVAAIERLDDIGRLHSTKHLDDLDRTIPGGLGT